MRRWIVGLITLIIIALAAFWFWRALQTSEVIEVRAKVLPVGFVYFPDVRDLNGDGSDELLVQVSTQPWLGRRSEQAFVVTMRDGRLIAHPTPFTFAQVSSTGGRRLIGIVESRKQREVAVGEWLPDGRWKVEKLGIKVHRYLTIATGDWDGDGEDNTALVLDANEAKVFIFQKRLKGQWDRVKEIKVSRNAWGLEGTEWGTQVYVTGSTDFPLFFWRGQWHLGQPNEGVALFNADWDSNGRLDKLLIRVSPDGKNLTTHLALETDNPKKPKEYLSNQWHFKNREVCRYYVTPSIVATNRLGDRRWHLLVLLMKPKPLTLQLMDYRLSPDRNWQVTELARWQVKGLNPPVDVLVGDSDGDRKAEIFVIERGRQGNVPAQWCFWRLVRKNSKWQLQPFRFPSRILGIFGSITTSKGLWFWQWCDRDVKLGTLKPNGQWKTEWQGQTSISPEFADLNDDGFPEVLTFQGQFFPRPVFWWRTEGGWRKQELVGSSLLRLINSWLHSPEGFVAPEEITVARWEGKKWFVVVWKDGVVQAVSLRH